MPTFAPPQDYLETTNPVSSLTNSTREEIEKQVREANHAQRLTIAEEDDRLYARHLALESLDPKEVPEAAARLIRLASNSTSDWLLYPVFKALAAVAQSGDYKQTQQYLFDSARSSGMSNVREYATVAIADSSRSILGEVFKEWQLENVGLFKRLVLSEPENYIRCIAVKRVLHNVRYASNEGYPAELIEFAEQWLLHSNADVNRCPYNAQIKGTKIRGYFSGVELLSRR